MQFTPEAAAKVDHARHVQPLAPTGIGSLDALITQHGVTAIEPVFAAGPSPEEIRGRFPERAMRAPADAEIPALSLAYTLTLDPAADLEEAAEAFASDPHVAYAHPNYLATALPEEGQR